MASTQDNTPDSASGPVPGKSALSRALGREKLPILLLCVALALLGLLYVSLIKPDVIGFYYDDGVYFQAAKGLAEGLRYRMLNEPPPAAPLVKYPPLFPLLLAPLWWLFPRFPENIFAFKLVPVLATLGSLCLIFRYAKWRLNNPWAGLIIALAIGTHFGTAWLASSLFSESVYILLSMLCVFALEKELREKGSLRPLPAAALCVLSFYTRTIGFALIPAVMACLWLKNEKKPALQFLGWSLLFIAPWYAWGFLNPIFSITAYDALFVSYNHTYLLDLYIAYQNMGGLFGLLKNGFLYTTRDLVDFFVPLPGYFALYLPTAGVIAATFLLWGGLARAVQVAFSRREVSIAALYCVFYLLMMITWVNDAEQYYRLLVPIAPFVLVMAWGFLSRLVWGKVVALALLAQFLAGNWLTLADYARSKPAGTLVSQSPQLWDEYRETFSYVRKVLPSDAVLLTRYVIPYWLYGGKATWEVKTYPVRLGVKKDAVGNDPRPLIACHYLLKQKKISYVVIEPNISGVGIYPSNGPTFFEVMVSAPELFQLVYTSSHGSIRIYRVL